MKHFLFLFTSSFFFLLPVASFAQHSFKAVVRSIATHQPLPGVSVTNGKALSGITDAKGSLQFTDITADTITLFFSFTGYATKQQVFNLTDTATQIILLDESANTLNDVTVISSIRTNDRIENATTKVEVLGQEEMNEESTLKPGNIASILGDVSGIQVQQSSATSGNSNVRIQGLDGKYTQILRDGMPLYGGYSGGFGILSIPPLDLKQIELIKGPASTLYGGGAIGGLINLVSKKPSFTPDASVLINQTTLKETNLNAYYSQRSKHIGFTFFAGQNFQKRVDVNDDGFSDVPDWKGTVIHPTLFIYPSSKTYISLSWSGSFETRNGGDMNVLSGKSDSIHQYFEDNKLNRNTYTLIAETHISDKITGTLKSSFSRFYRGLHTNTYTFNGRQNSYYNEASLLMRAGRHAIIGGVNITGDDFMPSKETPAPAGNISNLIFGLFAQDTWKVLSSTKLEGGLRLDHHTTYGNFLLPRLALFQRISKKWGTRLGFGMGYKTPNPLEPQIKDYDIYNLEPLAKGVRPETSYGGNAEINYKKEWNSETSFFINQAFFITGISHPVVADELANGNVYFINKSQPVVTQGSDTYLQVKLPHWEFYLGYTYTDAVRKYVAQNRFVPLTPRHRAASVISYETDNGWLSGVEGSYNGYQYREDGSRTHDYLFIAATVQKKIGSQVTLVVNCENVLDARQSRYESLFTGSLSNPVFKPLWAPIDGRVINASIRWQPFQKEK